MKRLSILTLAALLAAAPAMARPGGEGGPSGEERAEERAALFDAADANADGSLDIDEYTTFHELVRAAHLERRFSHLDEDADGAVSAEEMENGASKRRHHRGRR